MGLLLSLVQPQTKKHWHLYGKSASQNEEWRRQDVGFASGIVAFWKLNGCKKTIMVFHFRIPKVNARCTPSNKEKMTRRRRGWLKVLDLNLDLPANVNMYVCGKHFTNGK